MIKNYKNIIGDIIGNDNTVIQIIDKSGNPVSDKLSVLIDKIQQQEKKEKELLVFRIKDLENINKKKDTISGYQEKEIFQLKSDLVEKDKLIEDNKTRYATVLLELNGKDLTQTHELYAKAYNYFLKGQIQDAIRTLDRKKLIETKEKLQKEAKENADIWLFKAGLMETEQQYNEELNECYEFAVELYPSWDNCLKAADFFNFIIQFKKAEYYYKKCIVKSETEYQKAATLNNFAGLQQKKNEYKQAEQYYLEALEITRKLAEINPQTYLPNVALSLNNLANLQQNKNEFSHAEQSYLEALKIRRKLAEVNPKTYLPHVAETLNNLAVLQININKYNQAEQSNQEALKIYRTFSENNQQIYLPFIAMTLNNCNYSVSLNC